MMGSGKSALGREISAISGREFVDTDLLIEKQLCRPIMQVFKLYGEDTFRQHETAVLRRNNPGAMVHSTGGGIILRPENWIELKRLGTTVYLQAPIEALIKRLAVSKKRRPLLQRENWEEHLQHLVTEREPLYLQADKVVQVGSKDIRSTAEDVILALENQE